MEAPEPTEIFAIAENGDIILDVGEPDNKLKLLVSSDVLTTSSKVFAALLSPNFAEGQSDRSAQSPQTIPLPEDMPKHTKLMCQLLHGTVSPEELKDTSSSQILSLATLVDKYCLTQTLQYHSQALLLAAMNYNDPLYPDVHLGELAAAAYLFRRSDCFTAATERLMKETLVQQSLFTPRLLEVLPAAAIQAIEHKRIIARDQIAHSVPALLEPRCTFNCSFSDYPDMTPILETFMILCWPPQRQTVSGAVEKLQRLVGLEKQRCGKHQSLKGFKECYVTGNDIYRITNELHEICKGLCLWCVREGKDLYRACSEEDHRI